MSRSKSRRCGAALVEAALIMPVLLLIIAGTTGICNRIFERQSLTIAAAEGARVAIVPKANLYDITQQVEEIAQQRGLTEFAVTVEPANFSELPIGDFIEVTVSCECGTGFGSQFFFNRNTSATVSMMKEHE